MHVPSGQSRRLPAAMLAALLVVPLGTVKPEAAQATSGADPYDVPQVVDANADPNVVETTLVADETTVDIGGGVMAAAFTFNGTIPGPEFRLTLGQRVIVHFQNDLDHEPTGIHWHGIELANFSDGTPLTQNQVPPGGNFLYDFVVTRPGIFWYHPHHEFSTNQVFKGLYGSIIVTDPSEAPLISSGVLPGSADTMTLVLGDLTVCKAPGANDAVTYPSTLPWVGGAPLPAQPEPTPKTLCDTPIDGHGDALPGPLATGSVPNIQRHRDRVNEGQTVLTNGRNVGTRAGSPSAPGSLAADAFTRTVRPGQGIRLQVVDAATTRFFRLRLTDNAGTQIPLVRVGGEGGLLNDAVLEGTSPGGGFEFKYPEGEILVDPGDRADVVFAVPTGIAPGVATLWTQDFQRTGAGDVLGSAGWARTPSVPVAHFSVGGAAVVPAFTIGDGTPLRSTPGLETVEVLPAPTGALLDPSLFPTIELGSANQDIGLTANGDFPGIDGTKGVHDYTIDYTQLDHLASSRWGLIGEVLQLNVVNLSLAHHPFHLHGFSIQPVSLHDCKASDKVTPLPVPGFTYEPEFIDNIDVPGQCTLTLRVRLDDRDLPNGSPGGGLGRWMFHCHIFFHHHQGMVSELTVVQPEVEISAVEPAGLLAPLGTPVTVDTTVVGEIAPTYDWDDGTTTPGALVSGAVYRASRTFDQAGVYTVTATVESGGLSDSASVLVVVYDPSAGFVTGGGSIDSPPGAYVADAALAGPATFGFVSRYKKGAATPQGNTQFSFQAGDFQFESTSYDWLVVAGAKAQYKGSGMVNGTGNYGFLLTAIDGQLAGGDGSDRFRLKVWDKTSGDAIVYDNSMGSPDDIDAAGPQPLSAGSVIVHKGK